MADQPPHRPGEAGASEGWAVFGYLIGGIAVWGGIGWLVDRWLGLHGMGIAVGCLVGMAGAIYLIMKKLAAGDKAPPHQS